MHNPQFHISGKRPMEGPSSPSPRLYNANALSHGQRVHNNLAWLLWFENTADVLSLLMLRCMQEIIVCKKLLFHTFAYCMNLKHSNVVGYSLLPTYVMHVYSCFWCVFSLSAIWWQNVAYKHILVFALYFFVIQDWKTEKDSFRIFGVLYRIMGNVVYVKYRNGQ